MNKEQQNVNECYQNQIRGRHLERDFVYSELLAHGNFSESSGFFWSSSVMMPFKCIHVISAPANSPIFASIFSEMQFL